MGKISNSINHYLSDNRRFADLFNGVYFQGEEVIRAEGRQEGQQARANEKNRTIVRNMLKRGMSYADIMAIAECDQEFIDRVRLTSDNFER